MIEYWMTGLYQSTVLLTAALVLAATCRCILLHLAGPIWAHCAWALLPLSLLAGLIFAVWPSSAVDAGLELPALAVTQLHTPFAAEIQQFAGPAVDAGRALKPALVAFFALWLLGAITTALRFVYAHGRMLQGLGSLERVGGWSSPAEYTSDRHDVGPMLVGLLHPRVILPKDFAERYTEPEQMLVIQHELMHHRRRDLWWQAAARCMQCVWWFHPVLHWATRRLQADAEMACDAQVIAQQPHTQAIYAQALLKAAEAPAVSHVPNDPRRPFPTQHALACAWPIAFSTPSSFHPLKARIMQLNRSTPSTARRSMAALLLTCASAAAIAAGATAVSTLPQAAQSSPATADASPVANTAATPAAAQLQIATPAASSSVSEPAAVVPTVKRQAPTAVSPATPAMPTPPATPTMPASSDVTLAQASPQQPSIAAPAALVSSSAPSATRSASSPAIEPANAASAMRQRPKPGPGQYLIEVMFLAATPPGAGAHWESRRDHMSLIVNDGAEARFNVPGSKGSTADACEVSLKPTQHNATQVSVAATVDCGGQKSAPRIITELGKMLSIGMTASPNNRATLYNLVLTVTRG